MEYITGTCVINERAVYKNGEKIFSSTDKKNLLSSLYQHFNWQYPRFFKMDNLSRLGFAAAELLLAGWDAAAYQPHEIAVVLSNANSSLDTDYKYTRTTKDIPSPSVFVYTLPNIVIGEICIRHRFKGENAFFLSTAFDATLLMRYVSCLLEAGVARTCITGWVEWLGESYKAVLFLIERKETAGALPFTTENMDRIFKTSMTCE
ncbi:MAG TPA: hypothetical protein VGS79_06615 [Puia sp.]|nr:hypothetical protein [Puia sp.]